jgi:uncharacterized protein (DUF697 family)/GTP-binding protein EngB required for normal cell division
LHDNIDLGALVKKALADAFRELGHVNVLIAGRTGVGKSTLINAIFQGQLATTGQGKPVTPGTREITKAGIPLSIFDTRGLEMADFAKTLAELRKTVVDRASESDARQHIHVGWVCISEDLRRVEPAEEQLTEMLAEFMPVVAVITKARADQGFRNDVQRLLPKVRNVMRVRAIREVFDDGHSLPQTGLEELVNLTVELVPEAQRRAFTAAQKVDIELKKTHSRMIVATAAASAAAVAYSPIPFSDWMAIVPIQVGMIAGITATFGLSLSVASFTAITASAITGAGATFVGRAIASGLIKFVPGVGSVAGGAISAATASTITSAFGQAYITTLAMLFMNGDGEPPTEAEVVEAFKKQQANPAVESG